MIWSNTQRKIARGIDGMLPHLTIMNLDALVTSLWNKNIVLNEFKNPEDPDYEEYKSTHAEYSFVKSHERGCPALHHILIIRVDPKKLKLGMSRPCYVCQEMLLNYGVKRVTYSSHKGESFVTERVLDMSSSESD